MEILYVLLFLIFIRNETFAQISPPGLGKTNIAFWSAVGLKQNLDSLQKIQSVSYVGLGRKSSPNNYNLFEKQAILIFNQEFFHQFHKNLQYSFAISYRRQNEYLDTPPYEADIPDIKQEFRFYCRFSYIFKTKFIKTVLTARQELRKFLAPDFSELKDVFQLRSRFRMQATIQLDKSNVHKIVGGCETLFGTTKKQGKNNLTPFIYIETRFCLYYTISPRNLPVIFNLGYMCNLIGTSTPYVGHYLAWNIIVQNPFGHKKQHTPNLIY